EAGLLIADAAHGESQRVALLFEIGQQAFTFIDDRWDKRGHANLLELVIAPSGAGVDANLLASIAAACRDADGVGLVNSARGGASRRRPVEPLRLVGTGRGW